MKTRGFKTDEGFILKFTGRLKPNIQGAVFMLMIWFKLREMYPDIVMAAVQRP